MFGVDHAVNGPPQRAFFEIEVDEDDGCVWIVVDGETVNLGPIKPVADKWAEWLAERDFEA